MSKGSIPPSLETLPLEPQSWRTAMKRRLRSLKPKFEHLGQGISLIWAVLAAVATTTQPTWVQLAEHNAQTLFYRLRGSTPVPSNIVILAIDDTSLIQLGGWPLRRQLYAQVIDKLMKAGARSIAVDIIWDLPSSYGSVEAPPDCLDPTTYPTSADDRALRDVLQRYDGLITLAAFFSKADEQQWEQSQLRLPFCPLRTPKMAAGTVNILAEPEEAIESEQRIYRLGSRFLDLKVRAFPDQNDKLLETGVDSFAQTALKTAGIPYPKPQGSYLFFYGPPTEAFREQTIPFWYVLSPENWNSSLLQRGQFFKDKLVIIGPTASNPNDAVRTPMGMMPGVEFQATSIATLMEGRTLQDALPNPWGMGVISFGGVMGAIAIQSRVRRIAIRLAWAGVCILGWSCLSYSIMTYGLRILPTAVPMGAIGLVGVSYSLLGLMGDRQQQQQLRQTLKRYGRSPLVQEIIEQQNDASLKHLLQERQLELQGKKLGGRYKVIQILGSGGFGETYVAEDIQRPGQPRCVVKQLHPSSDNPKHLKLARRLFKREAETLEKLGTHDQIPRLLAYFEEESEFYLVQEFIPGLPLSEEFAIGHQMPEAKVITILRELLQVLSFVHEHGVIHRDIKPSNIIKRASDGKLVLIDFGAVKAIQGPLFEEDGGSDLTIGIGTQGYMPPEQCAGQPRLNSDLYAVGMLAIQALTGLPPSQIKPDPTTGELLWQDHAHASSTLTTVLTQLTRYDFQARYQQAIDALQDLGKLAAFSALPDGFDRSGTSPPSLTAPIEQETQPWPTQFGDPPAVPPTEPLPTQEEQNTEAD